MTISYRRRILVWILIALTLLLCLGMLFGHHHGGGLGHHHSSDLYCPVCQILAQKKAFLAAMPLIIFGFLITAGAVTVVAPEPVSERYTLVAEKVKITS